MKKYNITFKDGKKKTIEADNIWIHDLIIFYKGCIHTTFWGNEEWNEHETQVAMVNRDEIKLIDIIEIN